MHIAPAAPGTRDIVTENDVGVLVRRFYQAVIPDTVLGPVFEHMRVDWSAHIPKLCAYWARQLLGSPGYHGNTIAAHRPVPYGDAHVERWLELWEETVDELFAGPVAELAKHRAHAIGGVLRDAGRHRPPLEEP